MLSLPQGQQPPQPALGQPQQLTLPTAWLRGLGPAPCTAPQLSPPHCGDVSPLPRASRLIVCCFCHLRAVALGLWMSSFSSAYSNVWNRLCTACGKARYLGQHAAGSSEVNSRILREMSLLTILKPKISPPSTTCLLLDASPASSLPQDCTVVGKTRCCCIEHPGCESFSSFRSSPASATARRDAMYESKW